MKVPVRISSRWSQGFTLIELLVVISIIALLVGLLLPALGQARQVAITARCLANQHQFGIAMAGYEADNNGALPGLETSNSWYQITPVGYPGAYEAAGLSLYATFSKANPQYGALAYGTAGQYGDVGFVPPDGDQNPQPVGLGHLGQYLSSDGELKDADGHVFYDPGNPCSYAAFSDPNLLIAGATNATVWPRDGSGLYSIWLSDWGKTGNGVAGQTSGMLLIPPDGNFVSDAPWVYGTYFYRGGAYIDSVDPSNYYPVTNGAESAYHWLDASGIKSDATFLSGESYMCCWSNLENWSPASLSPGYLGELTHGGKTINRAFHDGSASSWAVPNGKLPLWGYTMSSALDPSLFDSTVDANTLAVGGYQYQFPYYFVLLDNMAPWQYGTPGF